MSTQEGLLKEISDLLKETKTELVNLQDAVNKGIAMEDNRERAIYYHDTVMKCMQALRTPVDQMEYLVDKEAWPMPSYGDMIFEV